MTPTPSTKHEWDKCGTAVTVAFLALFISVLNTAGTLLCLFRKDIVRQEANPEIHIEREPSESELHDQRVRDQLERNQETQDAL